MKASEPRRLRIVPSADLSDRATVAALILETLQTGRVVPGPVAEAWWALVEDDLPGSFSDHFAVPLDRVPDGIDCRRLSLLADHLSEERWWELEGGARPTAAETELWQSAWLQDALRGDDADVAGAVCLQPLDDGGGAVGAAVIFGWEAHGRRIEHIGFFESASVAFDHLRQRFAISLDHVV